MILKVEDVVLDGTSSELAQYTPQSLDIGFERVGNSGARITKDRIRHAVSARLEKPTNSSVQQIF